MYATNNYVKGLEHSGIRLTNGEDILDWTCNSSSGQVDVSLAYDLSLICWMESGGSGLLVSSIKIATVLLAGARKQNTDL